MRTPVVLLAALALGACSKGASQADALDHAASQADPAAAAAMRNEADAIRASGSDANLADPNSPAQAAMARAGAAAAGTPATAPADNGFGVHELVANRAEPASRPVGSGADTPGATPHKAGEPVPHTTTPTTTR